MKKAITASLTDMLVAGALLIPAAVNAQTKAAATAAPATAAPATATPAAPVAVTPDARAAIKELIETTRTRDNLSKAFQAMSQSLAPQMAQAMNISIENNASLSAEQKQKVRANMTTPFDNAVKEAVTMLTDPKVVDESIERMYPIYAKYYTPDEIRQITAFYKTPVGTKSLTAMSQVINESMAAGFSVVQPRLNALMEKTVKKEVDVVTKGSPVDAVTKGAPAKK